MRIVTSLTTFLIVGLLVLIVIPCSDAAEMRPGTLLENNDKFGSSVAVFGKWAMVGATGDDNYAGKVYVFENNNGWKPASSIAPLDISPNDYFGTSIDISADIAVIGANGADIDLFPQDLTNNLISNAGAAYLFQYKETKWQGIKTLAAFDARANADYGASVGVFDRFVIVGAPGAYGGAGAAYIYQKPSSGDGWSDLLMDVDATRVMAPTLAIYDYFGASVAISSEFAAVGAFGDDETDDRAGAVYLFQRRGDGVWVWNESNGAKSPVKLPHEAEGYETYSFESNDMLGMSVAIDGNVVVAGAPGALEGQGMVTIFRNDGDHWTIVAQLNQPGVVGFGNDVAIKGNYLMVGVEEGPAYVYKQSDVDVWTLDNDKTPFEPVDGNGAVSRVDIEALEGVYHFVGGMPEKNNGKGAVLTEKGDVVPVDDTIVNTAPFIYNIDDQIMRANDEIKLPISFFDLETSASVKEKKLSIVSGDLTEEDLSLTMDGSYLVISSTNPNHSGTARVTITVEDECGDNIAPDTCPETDDASFLLTVADIPAIKISETTPGPYIMDEIVESGQSPDPITVEFSVESPGFMQNLAATSSNQNVVPDSNLDIRLIQQGESNQYSLDIMPNEQISGSVQITIIATVADGPDVSKSFLVTINDVPRIDLPESVAKVVETSDGEFEVLFNVYDVETSVSELEITVEVVDDPKSILSGEPYLEDGSANNGKKLVLPLKANTVGSVALKINVTDENGASASSELTLNLVYGTSTIITGIWEKESDVNLLSLDIEDRKISIQQGDAQKNMVVGIADGDAASINEIQKTAITSRNWVSRLTFSDCYQCPDQNNPGKCKPNANIETPYYECPLAIEPDTSADTSPNAIITIKVDDGDAESATDEKSFYLNYNTPPTLTPAPGETFLNGATMNEDGDLQVYTFVIEDDSTVAADLEKEITSNNTSLFDISGLCGAPSEENCLSCVGGDCDIRVKPAKDAHGVAKITIKITDEHNLFVRKSFNITVSPVNDRPVFDQNIPPVTMDEDAGKAIDLVFSDADGDDLTMTMVSENENLIPNDFNNLKICEVPEDWEGEFDENSPDYPNPPEAWVCYPAAVDSPYLWFSDSASALKLYVRPAEHANSELMQESGSVIGPGTIQMTVEDGNGEQDVKIIKVTVNGKDSAPNMTLSSTRMQMFDDRDKATAEEEAIDIEINHPDGQKTVAISVQLADAETCSECVIPIDSDHAYFIDENGVPISGTRFEEEVQPGSPLNLKLALVPKPNVIASKTKQLLKVVVENSDNDSFSHSETIEATVETVNDPPTIIGLKDNYPCVGCVPEPPWLQDEPKSIVFSVDDPDPHDETGSLEVSAQWAESVDPAGEYRPMATVSDNGLVNMWVRPPDLVNGLLSLSVIVEDAGGLSYSQNTTINIKAVNYPPEIEPYPTPSDFDLQTNEEEPVDVQLKINDVDTEGLSALTVEAEWISLAPTEDMPKGTFSDIVISDEGIASLTITPPNDWPKKDQTTARSNIVLTVREPDGVRSGPLSLELSIQAMPDAPRITSITSLDPAPTILERGSHTWKFWVEDVDTMIDDLTIETSYDPGVTGLKLSLSSPVCEENVDNLYKKRCELTATGAEQSFGQATISIVVAEKNTDLEATLQSQLVVQEKDDPPIFKVENPNPPVVTDEDTMITVTYAIDDPDSAQADLQVVPGSLKWTWTASTTPSVVNLELVDQGNTIVITPINNGFGNGVVSLQVTDGTTNVPASFDVEVVPKNDYPVVIFTDSPTAGQDPIDLKFTVSDVETPIRNMTLSYKAEWIEGGVTRTLPNKDHILVIGTGEARTLRFTPPEVCSKDGAAAIITVEALDDDGADPQDGSDQVMLEYPAVDYPPVVEKKNGIYFERIDENSGPHFVDFVVSKEPACRPATLVMTTPVVSGDPDLLPAGNYYYDQDFTGPTRRLVLEPAQNKWGAVDISVSVLDASTPDRLESEPLSFVLQVDSTSHSPTISTLMKGNSTDQVFQIDDMYEDATTQGMGYVIEVNDLDTPVAELIMGAVWAPVPGKEDNYVEGAIRFEGTEAVREVIIEPDEYDNGYAMITPWVKDGADESPVKSKPFVLNVRPINNPPIINAPISHPDDIVFVEADEQYVLRFQVWDRDSVLPPEGVSAESGDTSLLPQTNPDRFDWEKIANPQDNMTHRLMMKPFMLGGTNYKDVKVTIIATDGIDETTFQFTLRVVPNATPPRIDIQPSVNVWEDQEEAKEVVFKVSDDKKAPQDLDVFVSSGDQRFIPNSVIKVDWVGGDEFKLTFRPALNAPFDAFDLEKGTYVTPLVISVYNDFFEAVAELSVIIHNRNDAPEISDIERQTVRFNETVEVSFTINDIDEGPDNLTLEAKANPDIADFEFSPDTGESRVLKVFPNAESDDQRTIEVTVTVIDTSGVGVVNPSNGHEKNYAETTFFIYMSGVAPGDVDGDGAVGLGDAVTALQVLSGISTTRVFSSADINGDNKIGLAEALNALKQSGARR